MPYLGYTVAYEPLSSKSGAPNDLKCRSQDQAWQEEAGRGVFHPNGRAQDGDVHVQAQKTGEDGDVRAVRGLALHRSGGHRPRQSPRAVKNASNNTKGVGPTQVGPTPFKSLLANRSALRIARPEGVEPSTNRVETGCSIH